MNNLMSWLLPECALTYVLMLTFVYGLVEMGVWTTVKNIFIP